MTIEEAEKILEEKGQSHVMKGFDELSGTQQCQLLAQIEALDWDAIALAGVQK